jgi:hypothetical protein
MCLCRHRQTKAQISGWAGLRAPLLPGRDRGWLRRPCSRWLAVSPDLARGGASLRCGRVDWPVHGRSPAVHSVRRAEIGSATQIASPGSPGRPSRPSRRRCQPAARLRTPRRATTAGRSLGKASRPRMRSPRRARAGRQSGHAHALRDRLQSYRTRLLALSLLGRSLCQGQSSSTDSRILARLTRTV